MCRHSSWFSNLHEKQGDFDWGFFQTSKRSVIRAIPPPSLLRILRKFHRDGMYSLPKFRLVSGGYAFIGCWPDIRKHVPTAWELSCTARVPWASYIVSAIRINYSFGKFIDDWRRRFCLTGNGSRFKWFQIIFVQTITFTIVLRIIWLFGGDHRNLWTNGETVTTRNNNFPWTMWSTSFVTKSIWNRLLIIVGGSFALHKVIEVNCTRKYLLINCHMTWFDNFWNVIVVTY